MKNKIVSVLILIVLLLSGCGFPNEPMFDDAYTRNIYLSEYSIERELADGTGGYWHEYNLGAIDLSPGASGATQIVPNVSTLGGYQFNAINEYLYFTTHVEDDWDGITDGILEITFEVNDDNTLGNDADTVDFQVECWHKIPGELVNNVVSLDGSTVVGQSDQHELFIQDVIITDMRVNEVIAFRVNLNTIDSEVADVIVNYFEFKYPVYIPAMER